MRDDQSPRLLPDVVRLAAGRDPAATLLVDGDDRWDAASFRGLVDRFAADLRRHTRPGDRVAVVSDNDAAFVALLYAVPAAGCVLTMGNTRHTTDELLQVLQDVRPTVVIAAGSHLDRIRARAGALPSVTTWWSIDDLSTTGPDGTDPDGQAQPDGAGSEPESTDPAWLIHTSGTTGAGKGVVLTHASVLAAVAATSPARPMGADDVYLFPFPLFHVAAYNVIHAHAHGRPVVLAPRFDAATVLADIQRERVTQISLAPTMLTMLLDHPDREHTDLSSLRRISYGASPMAPELIRRTLRTLPGVGLAQGYGMTELSGNAVFLGPDEHRRGAEDRPDLLRAAGRPGPGVTLRIADDTGDPLPSGTTGEILVSGAQVCAGYWERPDADLAGFHVDVDGTRWLRTGDVGVIDDDGVLFVVDRLKDIIITGGENVASREVEELLLEHPDVAAAAVVAAPDDQWGERVCAVVVWGGGTRDADAAAGLIEWTSGRIAGFKRPRRIVGVEALPTNASGKVDKRALRQLVQR